MSGSITVSILGVTTLVPLLPAPWRCRVSSPDCGTLEVVITGEPRNQRVGVPTRAQKEKVFPVALELPSKATPTQSI